MNDGILGVRKDESLEVKESQVVITNEIGTFPTINIPLLECLI